MIRAPGSSRKRFPLSIAAGALTGAAVCLILNGTHRASAAPTSPEKEAARLAKNLKPIPDDRWKAVAGTHLEERYKIEKGDTLYDISKRLFGDAKYWPKIWALNHATITNPHWIKPGNEVAFVAGSGTSLPSVNIASAGKAGADGKPQSLTDARDPNNEWDVPISQEWKSLPIQSWESVEVRLPPQIDPQGIDLRSKVELPPERGFFLPAFASTEQIEPLGEITGGRIAAQYLSAGDTVFIHAREGSTLQVGETYSITRDPVTVKSKESGRAAYSYTVLGNVMIQSVRDNIFTGVLSQSTDYVPRGSVVIPFMPKIKGVHPTAAPQSITGSVVIDHTNSTFATAQYKTFYVDRGTEDGVQPGMIFRIYQRIDPSNDKQFTESDFIVDSNLMVLHATTNFSTVLAILSHSPIYEGAQGVLLTDVSDLIKVRKRKEKTPGEKLKQGDELDKLDQLDSGGALGKEERKELKQLEDWKGNPEPSPSPSPDASPGPEASPSPAADPSAPAPEASPAAQAEPAPPPPTAPATTDGGDAPILEDTSSQSTPPPANSSSGSQEVPIGDAPPPQEPADGGSGF